jgi:hypothetical protein
VFIGECRCAESASLFMKDAIVPPRMEGLVILPRTRVLVAAHHRIPS